MMVSLQAKMCSPSWHSWKELFRLTTAVLHHLEKRATHPQANQCSLSWHTWRMLSRLTTERCSSSKRQMAGSIYLQGLLKGSLRFQSDQIEAPISTFQIDSREVRLLLFRGEARRARSIYSHNDQSFGVYKSASSSRISYILRHYGNEA